MATLALPPPPPAIIVPEENFAQGPEGQSLRRKTAEVWRHWNEPLASSLEAGDEYEEPSYRSVPLEKAFSVRVRYRFRGVMQPRRMPPDE